MPDELIPIKVAYLIVCTTATCFYILMSIVSMRFFIVNDEGARKGKKLIAITAGTSSLVAIFMFWHYVPSNWSLIIMSGFLYVYAYIMFIWSWKTHNAKPLSFAFSNQMPRHVITTGPNKHVRHPFYSSYCAAWLGFALATPHWLSLCLSLTLISLYVKIAQREEKQFKDSTLSEFYLEYSRKTPSLIPILMRTGHKP